MRRVPKILIVDDEEFNRLLFSTVVTSDGYTVIEAQSGEQALEMARAHLPDLVVVDLGLPDMHGTQLIKRLRSDPDLRNLRVALYTATAQAPAMLDFMQAMKIRVTIPKPSEPQELLSAVRLALE